MTVFDAVRARRGRRLDHQLDGAEAERLAWAWREACAGSSLGRTVSTVTGPTTSTPKLTSITLGPPVVLIVQLLPGQMASDVRRAAPRLAGHLGAVALRIDARGLEYVRIELLPVDPLDGIVEFTAPHSGVWLARCEDGRDLHTEWADLPHIGVQGQTRSGKTAWCYSLLAQAVRDPAVRVAGLDASGLLLRPFAGSAHEEWQACGLADLDRVEKVLAALVAEMDARIAGMPADRDQVETSLEVPLTLVVLEEWPGVLRAVDAAADSKMGRRVRALVARLAAEGHKAGYRLVMVAQRFEATVVGGAERAQLSGRLSFRLDNADSVKLLHPAADLDLAGAHAEAPDGVALLSWPGRPLSRVRAPWIGGYPQYAMAVHQAAR